jgi:hypothetical protein
VRQGHRVGRHDGRAGGHGLQRHDALQLGDARHDEHRRAPVGRDQLVVVHEAEEAGAGADAELGGQALPLLAHRPVADDLQARLGAAGSAAKARSSSLTRFSWSIRPTNSTVGGPAGLSGTPKRSASIRTTPPRAGEPGGVLHQLHGARRRRGDDVGVLVDVPEVPPAQARHRPLQEPGHARVGHQVLRHEVVGGDDRRPGGAGGVHQAAADGEVALDVEHVRGEVAEQPPGAGPRRPRPGHAERRVPGPAERRQRVHRDTVLDADVALPRVARARDVHLVAAAGEALGELRGEAGQPVDVGVVGLGTDEDAHDGRAFRGGDGVRGRSGRRARRRGRGGRPGGSGRGT